jgi:hypothetical protein
MESVPRLTVVGPVKLLLPERISVPAPLSVSAPVPEMIPESVCAAVLLKTNVVHPTNA